MGAAAATRRSGRSRRSPAAGGDGRLARRRGRHRGGDGGHRPVLEAGLVRAGGAGVRAEAGQRPPRQDPARAARPTSATRRGWPSCSSTGCCGAASCRPPAIRELRDLTRYRKRLIQAHTAECQRIQKTLEDAGIKLDSVASTCWACRAGRCWRALVAGERDPAGAGRAGQGPAAATRSPSCARRCAGRFRDHHALLVRLSPGPHRPPRGARSPTLDARGRPGDRPFRAGP